MIVLTEQYQFTKRSPEERYKIQWYIENYDLPLSDREIMSLIGTDIRWLDSQISELETRIKKRMVPFEQANAQLEQQRERQRKKKEKRTREKLAYVGFEVIDGKLYRVEYWTKGGVFNIATNERRPPILCGKRVTYKGESRTTALVIHEILTGERLDRQPRERVVHKRYQARTTIDGIQRHLGCYATPEERDEVQAMAKIGIFPKGWSK